jgi:hypothetical protein
MITFPRNSDWSLSIFWKAAYPPKFCYAPHCTGPNKNYSFYLMLSLVWRICNFIRMRMICDDLTPDAIYCSRSTGIWTIHPIVIPETHSGGRWFHNDEEMEVAIVICCECKSPILPRRNEWPTKNYISFGGIKPRFWVSWQLVPEILWSIELNIWIRIYVRW